MSFLLENWFRLCLLVILAAAVAVFGTYVYKERTAIVQSESVELIQNTEASTTVPVVDEVKSAPIPKPATKQAAPKVESQPAATENPKVTQPSIPPTDCQSINAFVSAGGDTLTQNNNLLIGIDIESCTTLQSKSASVMLPPLHQGEAGTELLVPLNEDTIRKFDGVWKVHASVVLSRDMFPAFDYGITEVDVEFEDAGTSVSFRLGKGY
ncbi:MAG TPA: hypothetical protein VJJ20_03040 [Candidatus Paceibacterota bacterium]